MTYSKCHLNKRRKKTRPRQFSMKPARCGPGLRAMLHAFAERSGQPFTQTTYRQGLTIQRIFISVFVSVHDVYLITLYTSKWVQAVMLRACIREALGSTLGLDTNHRAVLSTSNAFDLYSTGTDIKSRPTTGCRQICYGFPQYLVYATTASFQIHCIHQLYHHLTHCSLDTPSDVKCPTAATTLTVAFRGFTQYLQTNVDTIP
jgi:hypothetical protein